MLRSTIPAIRVDLCSTERHVTDSFSLRHKRSGRWHNVLTDRGKFFVMPACSFSIPFAGSPADIHQKAQSAVHAQGGILPGHGSSGVFEPTVCGSTIAGSYQIADQALHVTIDSKPTMIPCSTIQAYLSKHLEVVGA